MSPDNDFDNVQYYNLMYTMYKHALVNLFNMEENKIRLFRSTKKITRYNVYCIQYYIGKQPY